MIQRSVSLIFPVISVLKVAARIDIVHAETDRGALSRQQPIPGWLSIDAFDERELRGQFLFSAPDLAR